MENHRPVEGEALHEVEPVITIHVESISRSLLPAAVGDCVEAISRPLLATVAGVESISHPLLATSGLCVAGNRSGWRPAAGNRSKRWLMDHSIVPHAYSFLKKNKRWWHPIF